MPGLGQLLIVSAHLKARPNEPKSCAQREAQAAVLAGVRTRLVAARPLGPVGHFCRTFAFCLAHRLHMDSTLVLLLLALYVQIIQEHGSNRHAVIMGDLNDFDPDVPDRSQNQPNSNVMRQLSADLGLHSVAGARSFLSAKSFSYRSSFSGSGVFAMSALMLRCSFQHGYLKTIVGAGTANSIRVDSWITS